MATETSTKQLLKRILREFISKYYGKLGLAVICMVIVAITTALHAWMMKPIFDGIFTEKNDRLLIILPIALLFITLIRGAAVYFQTIITKYVESEILVDVQLRLFDKLVSSDLSFIKNSSTGVLLSHFINDVNVMRQSVSSVLTNLIREALSLILLLGMIFYYLPNLAIIVFFILPLSVYPLYLLGRKMRKISHNSQIQMGGVTKQLEETFRGIKVVKAYNAEKFEKNHLTSLTSNLLKITKKGIRTNAISSPLMESLGGIALAVIIFYGGGEVARGNITSGTFVLFITSLLSSYKPMKSLSKLNTVLQAGLAAASRIFGILDEESKIKDNEKSQLIIKDGEININNVNFSYNDDPVISDLSLTVKKGEMIALVGPSGSGKSTIMNLLLRFYDVDSGEIKFDNHDIKEYSLKNLRNAISFVSQENFLFDDTIMKNLTYGLDTEISKEEVIAAAKKAQAHGFIMDLPEGYDAKIGHAGDRLSGGQKQRLVIARAILRNAPIVLLDEATSALDPISEKKIRIALDDLLQNKTAIVVAHRLQTIEHAKRIFFLKGGKIVASGTNQELLDNFPDYKKFYYGEFIE